MSDDVGSICDECPHPLRLHEMRFDATGTILICDHEDCECVQVWALQNPLEDASFNQEAVEALGSVTKKEGKHDR